MSLSRLSEAESGPSFRPFPGRYATKLQKQDAMKVAIDRGGCISCAVCWENCPEVFEQNPADMLAQVRPDYRREGLLDRGAVSAEWESCVRAAADGCPVAVITTEP